MEKSRRSGSGVFAEVTENGTIQANWIGQAKDYYYGTKIRSTGEYAGNGLVSWAADKLTSETRKRIEALINAVEKDKKMGDAIKLWREINVVWLKKTDTIDESLKSDLLERTYNASTSRDAINISRESLAHHVNYYLPQLVGIFGVDKRFIELMMENEEIRRKRVLESQSEYERRALSERLAKNEKELIETMDAKTVKHTGGPRGNQQRFMLHHFYRLYNTMNEDLERNLIRPANERDYSGNDIMWQYMHGLATDLYRQRRLPEREESAEDLEKEKAKIIRKRKKVDAPPPPPSPLS